MIGKSSGFVETLPKQVQARIQALRDLQDTHDEHETEYQKELKALQAKYDALYGELSPYGLYTAVLDLVDFTPSSCAPCCFAPEGNIESAGPRMFLVFLMGKSCAMYCHYAIHHDPGRASGRRASSLAPFKLLPVDVTCCGMKYYKMTLYSVPAAMLLASQCSTHCGCPVTKPCCNQNFGLRPLHLFEGSLTNTASMLQRRCTRSAMRSSTARRMSRRQRKRRESQKRRRALCQLASPSSGWASCAPTA